jgi:hypothetical protein
MRGASGRGARRGFGFFGRQVQAACTGLPGGGPRFRGGRMRACARQLPHAHPSCTPPPSTPPTYAPTHPPTHVRAHARAPAWHPCRRGRTRGLHLRHAAHAGGQPAHADGPSGQGLPHRPGGCGPGRRAWGRVWVCGLRGRAPKPPSVRVQVAGGRVVGLVAYGGMWANMWASLRWRGWGGMGGSTRAVHVASACVCVRVVDQLVVLHAWGVSRFPQVCQPRPRRPPPLPPTAVLQMHDNIAKGGAHNFLGKMWEIPEVGPQPNRSPVPTQPPIAFLAWPPSTSTPRPRLPPVCLRIPTNRPTKRFDQPTNRPTAGDGRQPEVRHQGRRPEPAEEAGLPAAPRAQVGGKPPPPRTVLGVEIDGTDLARPFSNPCTGRTRPR